MNPLATILDGLRRAHDGGVAMLDLLRATDALHPSVYLDAACGNLRLAIRGLECQMAQEAAATFARGPAGIAETLRTLDGLSIGFRAEPDPHDARLSVLQPQTDRSASRGWSAPGPPDLAWALARSEEARAMVAQDGPAAAAQRAIAERQWVHGASLTTWRTTPSAAATLVGLMRGGRPAPLIAPSPPPHRVDAGLCDLAAGLGWRPGPVADWLAHELAAH